MLGISVLGSRSGSRIQGLGFSKSSSSAHRSSSATSSRHNGSLASSNTSSVSSTSRMTQLRYTTATRIEPLVPKEIKQAPTSFSVPVVNVTTGESVETVDLKPSIFGVPVRTDLLHQLVVWHLANKRKGLASTKGRGEVAGSTRKIYKQKGTGNARAGTVRATQRVGSGAAHGPHPKSWKFKINKKVRKLAMACALSSKFAQGNLTIVDGLNEMEPRTKTVHALSKKLNWEDGGALVIGGEKPPIPFVRAAANIHFVDVKSHSGLSVYHILKRKHLVLSKEALPLLDVHVPTQ